MNEIEINEKTMKFFLIYGVPSYLTNKKKLREYNAFYHAMLPEKVDSLIKRVESTPGYEDWKGDYTPESLKRLGAWLKPRIETCLQTEENIEIEKKINYHPLIKIEVSPTTITDETFWLVVAIGMYFGLVFLKQYPNDLSWTQNLTARHYVDYGQPVIKGFGRVELNPVSVVHIIMAQLLDNRETEDAFYNIYRVWEKTIGPAPIKVRKKREKKEE